MIIKVISADITKLSVDVIVNAANTSLLGGGGVDGAIHKVAGKELLAECQLLNGCNTGEAKITKGYNLPCKYVIHTPGPIWNGGNNNEDILLKNCYLNSLKLAIKYHCKSIAFPAISTGVYGYPIEKACIISLNAINEFLNNIDKDKKIKEIFLVCFNDKIKKIYENLLNK